MADVLSLIFLGAHILAAILWIGAMGFSVMVLRQVIPRLGMPTRKELQKQLVPAVLRFIPITAVATIVFGAIVYLFHGDLDPAVLWGTDWGVILLVSLVLTIALFVFGILVVTRSSRSLLVHLNEEPCTHGPQVGRLQSMLNRGQLVAFVWGVVILALMVIASELG